MTLFTQMGFVVFFFLMEIGNHQSTIFKIPNTIIIKDCLLCVWSGRWAVARVPWQFDSSMFSTMNSAIEVIVWQMFYKELYTLRITIAIRFCGMLNREGKSVSQWYHSAPKPHVQHSSISIPPPKIFPQNPVTEISIFVFKK